MAPELDEPLLRSLALGPSADLYLDDPIVSCLAGLAAGVAAAVHQVVHDERLLPILARSILDDLEPRLRHLSWSLEQRLTQAVRPPPEATHGFAMGHGFARARLRLTDCELRRRLDDVLVHALGPCHHHEAHAPQIFDALSTLIASDLHDLATLTSSSLAASNVSPIPQEALLRLKRANLIEAPAHPSSPLHLTAMGRITLDLLHPHEIPVPDDWTPPWLRQPSLDLTDGGSLHTR